VWKLRRAPRPRTPTRERVARVVVVGRFPNPSFDYYLRARLQAPGMPPFVLADPWRAGGMPAAEPDGTFLLFCRYVHPAALRWVTDWRERLAGVGLFLDDDYWALMRAGEVTLRYKRRLWKRALRHFPRLSGRLDRLYVATPGLAARHRAAQPVVLPMAPSAVDLRCARRDGVAGRVRVSGSDAGRPHGSETKGPQIQRPEGGAPAYGADGTVRVVYHAMSMHRREHAFLRPIVVAALARRPQLRFEVVAKDANARMWQGIERVEIRPPLRWPAYARACLQAPADIALVPLTDRPANRARAPTKKIDVARLGAAGIFSACPAYADADSDELLVPNDRERWLAALLRLVDEPAERARRAAATRAVVRRYACARTSLLEA